MFIMDVIFTPVAIVVLINGLGFVLAYLLQTDKFTDILYSLSFIALVISAIDFRIGLRGAHLVIALMVVIWAIRLGSYLFARIKKMGRDERFDDMRPSAVSFLGFWLLQTLSVIVIGLPVIIALANDSEQVSSITMLGAGVWALGLLIESVADRQKSTFRSDPGNMGKFIRTGLWRYVRHPNYLGEIIVWTGVFISCIPFLDGPEWVAIISPLWIFILLRYISGIPLLEATAKEKYGASVEYKQYTESTGRLVPRIKFLLK